MALGGDEGVCGVERWRRPEVRKRGEKVPGGNPVGSGLAMRVMGSNEKGRFGADRTVAGK